MEYKLNRVVSISSTNPDFYAWGRNCKILNYSVQDSSKIINEYQNYQPDMLIENYNLFWEGYYNRIK